MDRRRSSLIHGVIIIQLEGMKKQHAFRLMFPIKIPSTKSPLKRT